MSSPASRCRWVVELRLPNERTHTLPVLTAPAAFVDKRPFFFFGSKQLENCTFALFRVFPYFSMKSRNHLATREKKKEFPVSSKLWGSEVRFSHLHAFCTRPRSPFRARKQEDENKKFSKFSKSFPSLLVIWCLGSIVTTLFTMCVRFRVASPISRGTTTCTTTKD